MLKLINAYSRNYCRRRRRRRRRRRELRLGPSVFLFTAI